MTSLAFAWRSLVRQPARAALGVVGIAAVGALLFDMLLLSRGLVVSFEDLLDDVGFDVRVVTTDALPVASPRIPDASTVVAAITGLPEVDVAVPTLIGSARLVVPERRLTTTLIGGVAVVHPGWTLVEGRGLHEVEDDASVVPPIVINQVLADEVDLPIDGSLTLRGACMEGRSALPAIDFRVVGIAEFPFDDGVSLTSAVTMSDFARTCGEAEPDEADFVMVASRPQDGAEAAAAAIRRLFPEFYTFTNAELVDRFQQIGLSYFRQISTVLATITLFFGFLLVATLLTVSVNQRLAEVATLRALGFPRRRITTDLLWESALLVGAGGLLALPLGAGLAVVLDNILRSMPGIPMGLHFFVFQPRAVVLHVVLLTATAVLAALYPVRLAARLPIASTLRNEVVS